MRFQEEWEKRKLSEEGNEADQLSEKNIRNQFPAKVEVQFRSDGSCFEDIMPTSKSPKLNPSTTVTFNHAKEIDDEEYRLFGTPSSSSSSNSLQQSDDKSSEDEMDDDTGTFFSPLTNVNAVLNFFVNNELTNSEIVFDYFNENALANRVYLMNVYWFQCTSIILI